MNTNIVLIGFMGVGKGQVGRALASRTSMFAVDCDDLIESRTNQKVKKIFADFGEAEFRRLEKETAHWLENNVKGTIISTGGGFVNVANVKKIGKIVYLHADYDTILAKIYAHPKAEKKIKKRPLLQNKKSAQALYQKRLPLYKATADLTVDVSGKDVNEIVEEIILHFGVKTKK